MNYACKKCKKEFTTDVILDDSDKCICHECLLKIYEKLTKEIQTLEKNIKIFERYSVLNELLISRKIYDVLKKIYSNDEA